ncbi:MAG TPA: cytochrome c peroxidase [Pseudolabrys sp.]|nr:cytochrome c peroxidase [Pseudolabrys sp.]
MIRRPQSPLSRYLAPTMGVVAAIALGLALARAEPIATREGLLPPGTELNEDVLDQPTELFASELAGGKRSYLLNLGDLLFSSPAILGGVARQAGISCATCHQQGSNNAKLFIPGLSRRPGTFDTTGALFNPKADNGVFDAVRVPSLRGAKYLAPYTHDGRFATLREFTRHAIVNEFAGPEPSPQVLDALVNYIQEISFLPNPKLAAGGRLSPEASEAAHRGEALFNKPFRRDAAMSCASCHKPDSAFVDHQVHDVGTGGWIKTPTLLNANFNTPYFHDGRYDGYDQVVDYFDRRFDIGLSESERRDLVAYLNAVGDAKEPVTRNSVQAEFDELAQFASVLETAIREHNRESVALTVDVVGSEWRELGEKIPPQSDTSVRGGIAERRQARAAVRGLVLTLRQVEMAVATNDFDQAAQVYADYRQQVVAAATDLKRAEPWSLFNPPVYEAHVTAMRRLAGLAQ